MSRRFLQIAAFATPTLALTAGLAVAGGPQAQRASSDADVLVDGAPIDYGQPRSGFDPNSVTAKDVVAARQRGSAWLVSIQQEGGGWGAGDWSTDSVNASPDVATTSIVVLALLRDAAGSDRHRDAIARGVRYVADVVVRSPEQGARLDVPTGTQPQYKLGQLVDTHLAALMLGEIRGSLDPQTNAKVEAAYPKAIAKVQMAQNEDGSFDSNGWAPVLSSSIAASSLDRAIEQGIQVDAGVIERNDRYQAAQVDSEGNFDTSKGAGVDLYAAATSLSGNAQAAKRAPRESGRAKAAEEAQASAQARIASDADGRLFSGFGSVGGEEILSYSMISDTLADQGGEDWKKWEPKAAAYLVGTQNSDGSWAGHHCITSRTFTTAAAMMTLGAGEAARIRAARVTGGKATKAASADGFAPDHRTNR